jgi:hypothetical protein
MERAGARSWPSTTTEEWGRREWAVWHMGGKKVAKSEERRDGSGQPRSEAWTAESVAARGQGCFRQGGAKGWFVFVVA